MISANVIESIAKKLVKEFSPDKVVLFGSTVNEVPRNPSDIDLCVVIETDNRRELLAQMYLSLDSEIPVDIVLYTPNEWEQCRKDTCCLAYVIDQEGVVLYG